MDKRVIPIGLDRHLPNRGLKSSIEYNILYADDLRFIAAGMNDDNDGVIKRIIEILNPNMDSADVTNLSLPKHIIDIKKIFVDEPERGRGLATQAIKFVCNQFIGEVIITTSITGSPYSKGLVRQAEFLEKLGFRHFNAICKPKYYGVPYIYLNGNPVTEIIHMSELEHELNPDLKQKD